LGGFSRLVCQDQRRLDAHGATALPWPSHGSERRRMRKSKGKPGHTSGPNIRFIHDSLVI